MKEAPTMPSDSFMITIDRMVKLSKIELKRFVIFAVSSIISFCFALFAFILAIVPRLQSNYGQTNYEQNQTSNLLFLGSLFLLIISALAFRSARLSALRLYTVVEPAKSTFSMEPTLKAETTASSINLSKSSAESEISKDNLPRTAAKFYQIIDKAKNSFLGIICQTLKPILEVQSFVKKQPLAALSLGVLAGNFLSTLFMRKRKVVEEIPRQESNIRNLNLQNEKPKENLLYSTLVDLSMMGLTFAIQTFIKEVITNRDKTAVSKGEHREEFNSIGSGQIIPFESRQRFNTKR